MISSYAVCRVLRDAESADGGAGIGLSVKDDEREKSWVRATSST